MLGLEAATWAGVQCSVWSVPSFQQVLKGVHDPPEGEGSLRSVDQDVPLLETQSPSPGRVAPLVESHLVHCFHGQEAPCEKPHSPGPDGEAFLKQARSCSSPRGCGMLRRAGFGERMAAFMIFLELSGREHFEMSSREAFLQTALGSPCCLLQNRLPLCQPQFYCSEDQPAPTHHGRYQKGLLCKGTSNYCQGGGTWGSSICFRSPQTGTHG